MNAAILLSTHLRHMRATMRTLRHNWIVSLVNKFVFLFAILSLVLIAWRWNKLPPHVPLWYSRPWGEDQLATPYWLLLLPAGAIFWYIVNIVLATYLSEEYRIFAQLLFLTSLLVSFLSFITLVKILFIVT